MAREKDAPPKCGNGDERGGDRALERHIAVRETRLKVRGKDGAKVVRLTSPKKEGKRPRTSVFSFVISFK